MPAQDSRSLTATRIFAAFALLAALFACIATTSNTAWATESCALTDEMRAQYAADGTLDERIAYAKERYAVSQEGIIATALQREGDVTTASNVPAAWTCGMPTTGKGYILAVAVEFPAEGDVAAMTFDDGLEAQANSIVATIDGASGQTAPYDNLHDYYERSSYGKLDLSCRGVCYTITAKHCRDYYNGNVETLVEEVAITLHEQGVDFSQYDGNDDGKVDGLYLAFAGKTTGWGSDWWPSKLNFTKNPDLTLDGKSLDGYVLMEDVNQDGARVLIHETGHMLGLEDYYAYDDSSTMGIATNDMMNFNDGDHNAFSKWLLGWIDDSQITRVAVTENGIKVRHGLGEVEAHTGSLTETIEAFTSDTVSEGGSFIVVSNDESILTGSLFTSYYLLQYDRPQGNQNYSKGGNTMASGLRVFRVQAGLNDDGTDFTHTTCHATSQHDMLIEALLPSDGGADVEVGTPFHTGASISPSTTPSTNFREDALGYTGIRIDVTNADDQAKGTVTFSYEAKKDQGEFTLTPAFGTGILDIGAHRFTASVKPDWSKMSTQGATLVVDGTSYQVRTAESDDQLLVSWSLPTGTITANSKCELVFPAGFFDLYGTASKELRIALTPRTKMLSFTESGTYEQTAHFEYGEKQVLSNVISVNGVQTMVASRLAESNAVQLSLLKLSADGQGCETTPVSGVELSKVYVTGVQAIALSNGRIFVCLNGADAHGDALQQAYWIDAASGRVLDSRNITSLQFTYLAALGDGVAAISSSAGYNFPCRITQIFSSDSGADVTVRSGNGIFARRAQGLSDGRIAGIDESMSTENGTVKIYAAEEVAKVLAGADGKSMQTEAVLDIPSSDAIEDVATNDGKYYVLTRHGSDATPWLELYVYDASGKLQRTTKIEGTMASRSTISKLTIGSGGEIAVVTSRNIGTDIEKSFSEVAAVAADGTFDGFASFSNISRVFWDDGHLYVTGESSDSTTKEVKMTWLRTAAADDETPQPTPEPDDNDGNNDGSDDSDGDADDDDGTSDTGDAGDTDGANGTSDADDTDDADSANDSDNTNNASGDNSTDSKDGSNNAGGADNANGTNGSSNADGPNAANSSGDANGAGNANGAAKLVQTNDPATAFALVAAIIALASAACLAGAIRRYSK